MRAEEGLAAEQSILMSAANSCAILRAPGLRSTVRQITLADELRVGRGILAQFVEHPWSTSTPFCAAV